MPGTEEGFKNMPATVIPLFAHPLASICPPGGPRPGQAVPGMQLTHEGAVPALQGWRQDWAAPFALFLPEVP